MSTQNFNVKEPIHVTAEKMNKIKTKERKISVTYTLKRFRETLKTLAKAEMLTTEEGKQLAEIYNNIYKREQVEELKL